MPGEYEPCPRCGANIGGGTWYSIGCPVCGADPDDEDDPLDAYFNDEGNLIDDEDDDDWDYDIFEDDDWGDEEDDWDDEEDDWDDEEDDWDDEDE